MIPRLLPAVLAVLATAGCLQTTVKPTERRVLTADEAAEADRTRKEHKAADAPVPTPPPESAAQEIERYRKESDLHPGDPQWHYLLGMAYEKQGKLELAETRYKEGAKLIQPSDQYTGPHYYLGRVLAKEGKYLAAIAELDRAVAVKPIDRLGEGYYLNPDYRESYYLLGAVHHKLGALSDSEQAFKRFLKYGGERDRVLPFFPELIAE